MVATVVILAGIVVLADQQPLPASRATPLPSSSAPAGAVASEGPTTTPEASSTGEPSSPPASPAPSLGITSCFGAAAIVRGFDACPQNPASRMVPTPTVAKTDKSSAYADNCWIYAPFLARKICHYGTGHIRIALVGNSHAGEWLPALQVLAKRNGWTISTFLASQCNATDAKLEFYSSAKTTGCLGYGRWVLDKTKGHAFDLVITIERQSVHTLGDTWAETSTTALTGYESYLKKWSAAGTNVLVLRDSPFPGRTDGSVPGCLLRHPGDHAACDGTPAAWRWIDPLFAAATALGLPGISAIDTTPFFCTDTVCPAVIGTVVTYFDASHMTATYARTVAPFIEPDILAALHRAGG